MPSLQYAAVGPNSPLAGSIGWFDFTGVTLNPGDSLTGLQGTFADGSTVTFDISSTATANGGAPVQGAASPIYSQSAFGNSGYIGVGGNPILYNVVQGLIGASTLFKITNITFQDANNNPINNYQVIAADAEQTGNTEGYTFFTNTGVWSMLQMLPVYNGGVPIAPSVTGVGTNTVIDLGIPSTSEEIGAPVLSATNPTEVDVTIQNGQVASPGRQGFAIGFMITKVTVKKDITTRINPADQFTLSIGGTPSATATTTGAATGLQPITANVFNGAGNTYTINEAMAPGSVTPLSGYAQTVTAVNFTAGGTIPVITGLPESIDLALGDVIEYTITNRAINADVSITKAASPSPAVAGNIITYTLTAANAGPDPAQNVTVTDALPAGIQAQEYSLDGGATWSPWTGSVNVGTLAMGGNQVVLVRGTLDPAATGNLVNTATVSSTTPDFNPANNTATLTTPITTSADMEIVKTVVPNPVVAGQSATYTLVVRNLGPSDALSVSVADAIPANLLNPQYSLNGGALQSWTGGLALGTMIPNAINTIQITGIVTPSAIGNLVNTATVTSATPDPNQANNTSTTTTPIDTSADLSITKTASPTPAVAGQLATYTLTVNNLGPSDAQSVLITDTVPAGLLTPEYSLDGGNTWQPWIGSVNVGTVPIGEINTILIRGTVDPAATGNLVNTAVVSSPTPDPNQANNTANLTTPINTSADLSVTKTASPSPVVAGQLATYTLTVNNAGPSVAQSVTLTDAIPANLQAPEYSLDGGLTWVPWLGSVGLGAVTVGPAGTKVVLIRGIVSPSATGNLVNTAVVSSPTPDPNQANNTATLTTPINTLADISVTKSVSPSPVVAGQLATYTVVVANAGPSDAQSVVLTDVVPAGMLAPQYSTDTILWNPWPGNLALGTIAVSTSQTVYIRGIVDSTATGNLVNTASVTSTTPDPDPNNNKVDLITPINASADISVTKTALPTPMVPGKLATYTLTVSNAGPSVAQTVSLVDAVPAALTSPQYSLDGGITWQPWVGNLNMGNLAVGASQMVWIRGMVDPTTVASLVNTAIVSSPTPDPVPGNNTANLTTQVAPSADLAVVKTVITSPVVAGQPIVYSLLVSNLGPSTAQGVVLSDAIVAAILNPQYSTDDGITWQPWTGSLALGSMAPGFSDAILIKGDLNPQATGTLDNQAAITSQTPDPDPNNNTSTVEVVVETLADVSVTKVALTTPIIAGNPVSYKIHVKNAGPSDAQNVIVTDALVAAITAPEYSLDGGITWIPWAGNLALNTLAAGAAQDILIRGTVAPSATGTLSNTVTVKSTTQDPDPSNNTATATNPITTLADLEIIKTVSPDPMVPGKDATYTLTVINHGPSDAQSVTVTDTAPTAMENPQYSTDNGVTWALWTGSLALGVVAPGPGPIILIKGKIKSSTLGSVANTAAVTSPTPDPVPSNNTDTINTPVDPSADLSVTKVASPSPIVPGKLVTYTIKVHNAGASDAQNVTVTDAVPAAIIAPEYSLDGGITWIPWLGNLVINPLIAGDTKEIQIRGMVKPDTTSSIINTVSVMSPTKDPDPSNNTATVQTPVAPSADVRVTKALTTPVVAGNKVGYKVEVSNLGPSTAQGVILSDAVPVALLNPEYSTDGGVTWQPWTGSLPLGDMAPNTVKTVLLRGDLSPSATGNLVNTASATSLTPDPDPTNNQATSAAPIDVLADVSVVNTLNTTPVIAGAPVAYTLTVKNAGPSDAQNVLLSEAVPPSILNPEYSTDGGVTWLSWTGSLPLGTMATGAVKTVLLRGTVSPSATGTLATTATVASTTPDPNLANNTSSNTAPITVSADIGVVKTSMPNPASPGAPITYTLTVTNLGPSDAQSVLVTDAVASSLDNPKYSLDGGITWQPWVGSLNIGTLPANKSQVIEITGILKAAVTGNLTNTVEVSSPTPDPNPANNTATIRTLVNKVELIKTSNVIGAVVGDTISYTLKVVNSGEVTAENMVVKDPLTAGLVYDNNLKVNGIPTAGNITTGISIGNVAAGQMVLITFNAKVTSVPQDKELENQGSASYVYRKDPAAAPIDAVALSNINKVTVYSPKLDMTKVSSTPSVVIGENFVYTIQVTNSGDITLNNVIVVDDLPASFIVQGITVDGVAINGDIRAGLNIGTLGIGQTKTLKVTIKVADTATISTFNNIAKGVGEAIVDPGQPPRKVEGQGTDTAGISLYSPKLVIVKSADKAYAILGDILTYTLSVTNPINVALKNIPLNNVVISDLLPPQLEFIPGSMNSAGGNILTGVNIGSLAVGETKLVTFQAKVISSDPRPIINTAIGRFEYTLPGRPMQVGTATSNPYTLQVTLVKLELVKVANQETISLGDQVTYTVTLKNTGEVTVTGVVFTDKLPEQVSFVEGSFKLNGQVVNNIDLAVGIIIPSIAVGESVTLSYTVEVTGTNCSGILVNLAQATYGYKLADGTTGTLMTDDTSNSVSLQMNISTFKQMSIESYLVIPEVKPDIEAINTMTGTIDICNMNVIETPQSTSTEGQKLTGYKLIIRGTLNLVIEYTALSETQSVHSAHYSVPFSTFIILPKDYTIGRRIEIGSLVEDIYYNAIDIRKFFANTTVLINAKILSC